MSIQDHLYNEYTVPDILEQYIKELTVTGDINNILHANKLTAYRNMILDKKFLSSLRKFFNQTYNLISKNHPSLHFYIEGRRKSLISTEKKILQYASIGKSLDLIRDFFAFRIILFGDDENIDLKKHCYSVIEEIIDFAATQGFTPCERLPLIGIKSLDIHENDYFNHFKYKQFVKDYICFPKENGYQSIHLVIVDTKGRHLEIQVRTLDMHYNAETLQDHKKYKEEKYLVDIPIEREKIKAHGYKDENIDFSGIEKALSVFQRQKTF